MSVSIVKPVYTKEIQVELLKLTSVYRDYFMVGECIRFLFTSCEGSLNERVSLAILHNE